MSERYTRKDVEGIAATLRKHMIAAGIVPDGAVIVVHGGSSTNGISWRVEAWMGAYGSEGSRLHTFLDRLEYGTTARGTYAQIRTAIATLEDVNRGKEIFSRVSRVVKGHTRKDGTTSYRVTFRGRVNGHKSVTVQYAGGEYADVLGWESAEFPGQPEFQTHALNMMTRTDTGAEIFPPNNETTIRDAMEDLADFYATGN